MKQVIIMLCCIFVVGACRSIPPGHDPRGPGNSENAPGHHKHGNGPGNSDNAPGHNKNY